MMAKHAQKNAAFALADDAHITWRQAIWDMIARTDTFVLVAEPYGFCCGWVSRHPAIYLAKEVGLLSEICVAAAARRMGVGQALIAACRAWFASRDVHEFQLVTAMFNRTGQRFFKAMGGRALLLRYHFDVLE